LDRMIPPLRSDLLLVPGPFTPLPPPYLVEFGASRRLFFVRMCPLAPSHIMSEAPHQGCTSHAHSVKTVNLSVTGQARVRSDGRTMWLLGAGAGKAGACQVGGLWIAFDKGTDGADRLRRVGGRTTGQGLRLHSTAWNALPLLLLSRCRRAPAS